MKQPLSQGCPLPGCSHPHPSIASAYGFAPFADDPARGRGGDPDVRLQLHFFLRSKEVLLLQLPINPALRLQRGGSMESGAIRHVLPPRVPTAAQACSRLRDLHPSDGPASHEIPVPQGFKPAQPLGELMLGESSHRLGSKSGSPPCSSLPGSMRQRRGAPRIPHGDGSAGGTLN